MLPPGLGELLLRSNNFAVLRYGLPAAYPESDVETLVAALSEPGALSAAMNYYRSLFRGLQPWPGKRGKRENWPEARSITARVLVIWGLNDRYLGRELTEGLERWAPNIRVMPVPHASHWVHLDAPELVNRTLVEFLLE